MASHALALVDVAAGYFGNVRVVSDVTAEFEVGAISTIIGPNGAGKSTLLAAIYGINKRMAGDVFLGDEKITSLSSWKRLTKGIGAVFQGRVNFPKMSVSENLDLGGWTLPAARRGAAKARVIDQFPMLREKLKHSAGNLSGGEQQVLEMAMVLQTKPKVLLLDEPSLGLSPKWQGEIFETISEIAANGVSIIIVEQNVRGALKISDRVLVMQAGNIILDETPENLENDERLKNIYLGGNVSLDNGTSLDSAN